MEKLTADLEVTKVEDGENGEDGVGVEKIEKLYYQSTSATTLTGGSWSLTAPDWESGKYIWTKLRTILTNGTSNETEPVNETGPNGTPGANGSDAISGYLTNDSIVVFADALGVVSDFSNAKGEFKVVDGITEVTSGITFSLVGSNGCVVTINSTTGVYTVTGMSANNGTATFQAVYKNIAVKKIMMISKTQQGPVGPDGKPTGLIESPTPPSEPYLNMLWKDTLTGTTKVWHGTSWDIWGISANNIVVDNLAALSIETGALNVDDWVTITSQNKGLRGSFDYGNTVEFQPKWLVGDWSLGQRFLGFEADVFNIKNGDKGDRLGYATAYFGAGYFKLRDYAYNNPLDPTQRVLRSRVDFAQDPIGAYFLQVADSWDPDSGSKMTANGISTNYLSGNNLNSQTLTSNLTINELSQSKGGALFDSLGVKLNPSNKNGFTELWAGKDGTGLSILRSNAPNERTTSLASNVYISATGIFQKTTSSRKYKLNISDLYDPLGLSDKLLSLDVKRWFDKNTVERVALERSTGVRDETLDAKLTANYGLIAEDVHDAGLGMFNFYDENGEVDGIQYATMWVALLPRIKDMLARIEKIEGELKNE